MVPPWRMPPRKKKTRRRRDTSIRLLNVLEAYTYASILSEGIMGNSPWGFDGRAQNANHVHHDHVHHEQPLLSYDCVN